MLKHPGPDLSADFMIVRRLKDKISHQPEQVNLELLSSLACLVSEPRHSKQKCAPFLYKEAAECLADIIRLCPKQEMAQKARSLLEDFSLQSVGSPCLAASQALGSLPLHLPQPEPISKPLSIRPIQARIEDLLASTRLSFKDYFWAGRSLVFLPSDSEEVLVLKLAESEEKALQLVLEKHWALYLSQYKSEFQTRFDLPNPLEPEPETLFLLKDKSLPGSKNSFSGKEYFCLAFLVHKDYFQYPCSSPDSKKAKEEFQEIIARNCWLFAKLTSLGLLHTAPIPLFHNRIQSQRRDDLGIYLWTRGGRLDRWLNSCRYPNFGKSGLRDFEHIQAYNKNKRELYRVIGSQILSLALVCGSFFRFRHPSRIGLDEQGRPEDLRSCFDQDYLQSLLSTILKSYCQGFTQQDIGPIKSGLIPNLARQMVEEMGVDRHMTEVLRLQDQEEMSDQEYKSFLHKNGYKGNSQNIPSKGTQEIVLYTGPHLGEFNGRISLPELIDFTAGCTALCISSKYLAQLPKV